MRDNRNYYYSLKNESIAAPRASGGNTDRHAKLQSVEIKLSKEEYASDTELVENYAPTSRMV